jgi:hypothetical protein
VIDDIVCFFVFCFQHFRVAARSRTFDLSSICTQLREIHCYPGIVELALYRADLLERREITTTKGIPVNYMKYFILSMYRSNLFL